MAVPSMLLAYGISLRLGPGLGAGEPPRQIAALVSLKLVVQPIAAYLIGAYAMGLVDHDLLAVTVIAALPTAQNVFTFAMRYNRGVILARDTIFVATLLSVPVILVITWLLAPDGSPLLRYVRMSEGYNPHSCGRNEGVAASQPARYGSTRSR